MPTEQLYSDDERRRILTHRLNDILVRRMLAGFLHQELRIIRGVDIPAPLLVSALTDYVRAVDEHLIEAEALYAKVFREPGMS